MLKFVTRRLTRVILACIFSVGIGGVMAHGIACAAEHPEVGEPGLLGKTIVIDPGHGGYDTGARGAMGTHEKDVTLGIALKLATLLRQTGAQVVLTRKVDDDLATDRDRMLKRRQRADLTARVNVVLAHHPDLFLSIHCNSVPSATWHGAQTIYQSGNEPGKQAAFALQDSFRAHLLDTTREPHSAKRLFVLRKVHSPAVLAEVGFLSNPKEEQFLRTDAYQQRIAIAIYMGTLGYFGESQPGWWQELRATVGRL